MNTLVVFAAIFAVAMANPDLVSVHQDTLGNYKYSIEGIHGLSRVEQRNIPVAVSGYSYIDPILRKVPVSASIEVEASPQVVYASAELPVLRKVELVEAPLIKEVEVKSSLVEVPVETTLLRVAPEVVELEPQQFAAHVGLQNAYHHFI